MGFTPQAVGSHWSRRVQVDVVAINWLDHEMLVGECKWTGAMADRPVVRELIETKLPLMLADMGVEASHWRVRPALFARVGVTAAARQELAAHQGLLIDLERLYTDLGVTAVDAATEGERSFSDEGSRG
jgi:hypothetical protein